MDTSLEPPNKINSHRKTAKNEISHTPIPTKK